MGNSIDFHFEIQPSKISTLSEITGRDGDLACVYTCVQVHVM